jgi:hypothetical protein
MSCPRNAQLDSNHSPRPHERALPDREREERFLRYASRHRFAVEKPTRETPVGMTGGNFHRSKFREN